jgi:hypothetical protein
VLELTIPQIEALNREWERYPPVRILLAHFVGYKPPERSDNYMELVQMFAGTGGVIR